MTNRGSARPLTDPQLLAVWPDAAKRLSLGKTKTWELVRSGELQTVRVGRRRLVATEDLAEFIDHLRADAS